MNGKALSNGKSRRPAFFTLLLLLGAMLILSACAETYRMVYSAGFTFASYDYLVVSKPDSNSSTSLYGLDVEFANLMNRYNWRVVGDKEFTTLTDDQKHHTLFARMSMISNSKNRLNLLTVSFDDAVTGKTVASVTTKASGNMFDTSNRTEAFEKLSDALVQALERDKGLKVTDTKAK